MKASRCLKMGARRSGIRRRSSWLCAKLAALMLGSIMVTAGHAGAPSSGAIYLSKLNGVLYRAGWQYDGAGNLEVSQPVLVAFLPRGGGVRVLPDSRIAVVGAGTVSLLDMANHVGRYTTANVNANAVIEDPSGDRLWCGWKDATLADVPLDPLAPGIPHPLTGSDSVITMLAFAPDGTVFYSTGGEIESGSLGHVDLGTFTTSRIATSVFATGIHYDPFTQTLITVGLGRARQYMASPPYTELSRRDDSGSGENYLGLVPTGTGHYVGTRFGPQARVVLLDLSGGGDLDDASTFFASTIVPGLEDLSGVPGIDVDLISIDGFEEPVVAIP